MSRYRPEPEPQTRGMLNRSPAEDCPLCKVWGVPWDAKNPQTWNKQHIYAEALWQKWDPDKKGWPGDIVAALDELNLGLGCTEKQASDHFRHHRPEQPMTSSQGERERSLSEAMNLSPDLQQVVLTIYRQRFLSTKQIQELFFSNGRSEKSAKQKTSLELTRLARMNMLYRYYPSSKLGSRRGAPKNFSRQALWFLGKRAAPFIEETLNLKVWPSHYVQMAKQIDENMVIHDLRLADLYVNLHRALKDRDGLLSLPDGRPVPASLNINNWYTVRHISFGFFDRLTQQSKELAADAFATLSLSRPSFASGDLPACQLPFFLEYDRGSKVFADVAGQILNYHLLALARSAGKRFPDLDPEKYSVPMIMVFSEEQRIEGIKANFQEQAGLLGLSNGSPILLTSEEKWLSDPIADDLLISAWDTQQRNFSLVDILLLSSEPLIQQKIILPSHKLELDMRGARRTDGGGARANTLAGGRQKLQERRLADLEEGKGKLGSVLKQAQERRREQIEERRKVARPTKAPKEEEIDSRLSSLKDKRRQALEDIKSSQAEPRPEAPKPTPPRQEAPKPTPPRQEAPKPTPPRQEAPKPTPPRQEAPKPTPPRQEAPKPTPPDQTSSAQTSSAQSTIPTESELRKRRRQNRRRKQN